MTNTALSLSAISRERAASSGKKKLPILTTSFDSQICLILQLLELNKPQKIFPFSLHVFKELLAGIGYWIDIHDLEK